MRLAGFMLDTPAETAPDRRPGIILCVYETDDQTSGWLNDAVIAAWTLPGARLLLVGPDEPAVLARRISDDLRMMECRAVLLVGRTRRSDGFRVQMRAENPTVSGGTKLSSTGPAMARATAPVSEMVRALNEAGLGADATSESEDDAGSSLLYRILTGLPDDADAPAVALLRAPLSMEPDRLQRGVHVAAGAIARHLSPLPRERAI
jgi:hypothetical protein